MEVNSCWNCGGGRFARLKLIWADSGYNKGGFVAWVKEALGWEVEVVEHPWTSLRGVWAPQDMEVDWEQIRPRGFHVLKWRGTRGAHVRLVVHLAQAEQRL
jgi:hypothetical protein